MKWGLEDVEMKAESRGVTLSEQDLKKVLISSLEDNDYLMEAISDAISETLDYLLEENIIKNLEQ